MLAWVKKGVFLIFLACSLLPAACEMMGSSGSLLVSISSSLGSIPFPSFSDIEDWEEPMAKTREVANPTCIISI